MPDPTLVPMRMTSRPWPGVTVMPSRTVQPVANDEAAVLQPLITVVRDICFTGVLAAAKVFHAGAYARHSQMPVANGTFTGTVLAIVVA